MIAPRPSADLLAPHPAPRPSGPGVPLHDAEVLTRGGVQAQIALNGQIYTLRITRAGKLILTK